MRISLRKKGASEGFTRHLVLKVSRFARGPVLSLPRGLTPRSQCAGFTVIEMIVAIGIFSFIMMISIGSLLSLLEANYKAQTLKVVINNLNFAVENMSRNLRTGSMYHCDHTKGDLEKSRDCETTPASSILFKARDGRMTIYRHRGTAIDRSTDGGQSYAQITSPDIEVNRLRFFVRGTSNEKQQPSVLLIAGGFMKGKGKTLSEFSLETYLTQRVLDI